MSLFSGQFRRPECRSSCPASARACVISLLTRSSQLGCRRALILSTPPAQADSAAMEMAADLKGLAAGVFTRAAMHTPVAVTEEAHGARSLGDADCVVALGGGSTTGLGKAIAYRTDLPQIVIPTTYAGSEATWILGQTENGEKTTVTDPKVQPEVILYDAELVRTPAGRDDRDERAQCDGPRSRGALRRKPQSDVDHACHRGTERPLPQPCPG
jgi:hypothetical protein